MTTKCCQSCGADLPFDQFNKNKHRPDGLHTQCKICRAEQRKKSRQSRHEYASAYRARNVQAVRLYAKMYRVANPAKRNANAAKRNATKLQATPQWLTQKHFEEIELCYSEALALRIYTGQEYHVDHIVPLQGETVCGLHVPWNLRVIPAKENLAKSNRLKIQAQGATLGHGLDGLVDGVCPRLAKEHAPRAGG